jgi:hypothetical protein
VWFIQDRDATDNNYPITLNTRGGNVGLTLQIRYYLSMLMELAVLMWVVFILWKFVTALGYSLFNWRGCNSLR